MTARTDFIPDTLEPEPPFDYSEGHVPGQGVWGADVMIVGATPLSQAAESLLRNELNEAGFEWDHAWVTTVVKTRGTPTEEDVEQDKPYLQREVREQRPRWILTLGDLPFRTLTGNTTLRVALYRGMWHNLSSDFALPEPEVVTFVNRETALEPTQPMVFATWHPDHLFGGKKAEQWEQWRRDLTYFAERASSAN